MRLLATHTDSLTTCGAAPAVSTSTMYERASRCTRDTNPLSVSHTAALKQQRLHVGDGCRGPCSPWGERQRERCGGDTDGKPPRGVGSSARQARPGGQGWTPGNQLRGGPPCCPRAGHRGAPGEQRGPGRRAGAGGQVGGAQSLCGSHSSRSALCTGF